MSTKSAFVSKCNKVLSKYLSSINAGVAITAMTNYQLKSLADSDNIPDDIEQKCIQVLFERIRVMKGNDSANQFINDIKK